MQSTQKVWIGTGLLAAGLALTLLPQTSVHAFEQPALKDVFVANTELQPVPVYGSVEVSGSTEVSGAVSASQSGTWTVGINPAQNTVKAESPSVFYDSGFGVINEGQELELGPIDLSKVQTARIVVYAVNGEIHAQIYAEGGTFDTPLDRLDADGEDNSFQTKHLVYEAPPPSIFLRLTESGPGGSNYRVLVIGR